MMSRNEQTDFDKKRTLKKVRTNFLAKRPGVEENAVVPVPKPVNPYKMQMVRGGWGLVEQDRNIHMGLKQLNQCLDVRNVKIEDAWNSRLVVLKPQMSNQACLVPWEYSVKRLESYGDLDLATLAHKMRECNGRYDRLVEEYQKLMESDNVEMIENVGRARLNVNNSRKKIESTYPYTVMKFLYDKNGANLHSITYNEAILREIGQSVEGFARWAESKGVPIMFPHAEKISLANVKNIVGQTFSIISEVGEGPEFEAFISDKNGDQRRVVIQNARICELTESGFLISIYTIVKNSSQVQQNMLGHEDGIQEKHSRRGNKWVKYESQAGTSMEQMTDKMME